MRDLIPKAHRSEIIEMALSDHVSFADFEREYGLAEKHVKALMRQTLKPGSYLAWRKRVRDFSDHREMYKQLGKRGRTDFDLGPSRTFIDHLLVPSKRTFML